MDAFVSKTPVCKRRAPSSASGGDDDNDNENDAKRARTDEHHVEKDDSVHSVRTTSDSCKGDALTGTAPSAAGSAGNDDDSNSVILEESGSDKGATSPTPAAGVGKMLIRTPHSAQVHASSSGSGVLTPDNSASHSAQSAGGKTRRRRPATASAEKRRHDEQTEKERKRAEREEEKRRLKEEKERERQQKQAQRDELRLQKEREKEQVKQLKESERLEREVKKRKELEEREREKADKERVRKEKEQEKEALRLEKEKEKQAKEDERRAKEEERRAKDEAAKREEERKQEKLRRQSQILLNFVKKDTAQCGSSEQPDTVVKCSSVQSAKSDGGDVDDNNWLFAPFPLKEGMAMATAPTQPIGHEAQLELSRLVKAATTSELYTSELAVGARKPSVRGPTFAKKRTVHQWHKDSVQSSSSAAASAGDERSVQCLDETAVPWTHAKLFQFHDNCRPPWYGTWKKRAAGGGRGLCGPRNPLGKQPDIDYDYDSDEDWEAEPDDAEECESDVENGNGDEEEDKEAQDDGFFVEHGYLSEGEGGDEEACADAEERRVRLAAKAAAWRMGRDEAKAKAALKPLVIGPVLVHHSADPVIVAALQPFKMFKANPDQPVITSFNWDSVVCTKA